MESDKFDAFARRAIGDGTRRGILRTGLGALAAAALAVVGLGAGDEAAAKNKHHGPNRKRNSHHSNQRKQVIAICYRGETLQTTKGKLQDGVYQGATQGACICPADRPITCGLGCCPNDFPQCCPTIVAFGSPGEAQGSECAPNTSRCCPINQGGGACDSPLSQCCPVTNQNPRGSCAPVDSACCNTAQGGGFCQQPFNLCCPRSNAFPGGNCCRPTQRCCTAPGAIGAAAVAAGCLAGQVCSFFGCCTANLTDQSGEEGASKQAGSEKVGIPA